MVLQRAQRRKFWLSTLSNSLRLEVNSSFTNTTCAKNHKTPPQKNIIQQSHRSGVSILSSPWNKTLSVHSGMTLLSYRLQRESSVRADKRDQSFSHYFHPFSATSPLVGSRFHNIDSILETLQSIISSIIMIKRSNDKPCLMKVFYCNPSLLTSCWILPVW